MASPTNNWRGNCANHITLTNTLRELWTQHVFWTRSFIISTAEDIGDLQYVTNRLLRNPGDFADALKNFYGTEKANIFKQLLTDHLTIAAELVNAAKAGNTAVVAEKRNIWYENADKIAGFLASLNPFWSKKMWQTMLYEHLRITEEEAVLRLNKKYEADVALFDEIEAQALDMADLMTSGIIRQFNL